MSDDKKPKKAMSGCLLACVAVVSAFGLLCGGFVTVFVARNSSATKELNQRLDQLRSEGKPIDDASLSARYESDTDSSKANAWIAILDQIDSEEFRAGYAGVPYLTDSPDVPAKGQSWPDEQITRTFLQRWESLRNELHMLTEKVAPVRFPIQFESFNTKLDYTQRLRHAARVLQLECVLAIRDGDPKTTFERLHNLLELANVNSAEPFLVSGLMSIAIDSMAIVNMQQAVEKDSLTLEDLEALVSELAPKLEIGDRWAKMIQGERAGGISVIRDPSKFEIAGVPFGIPGRSRDALYYIDLMEQAERIPTADLVAFHASLEQIDNDLRTIASASTLMKVESAMTVMVTPALSAAGDAMIRQAMLHRLATLGAAIRIYEKKHSKLPAGLSDLSNVGIALEKMIPYGDKPFGYKLENGQAILWGFSLRQFRQTPGTPPSTAEGEEFAEENKMWVWQIPAAK